MIMRRFAKLVLPVRLMANCSERLVNTCPARLYVEIRVRSQVDATLSAF
jgi:hypothetical protein